MSIALMPSDVYCLARWKYTRNMVVDGNFHAEHMKMRRGELDVALADGTGFMVGAKEYQAHLKSSAQSARIERIGKEVSDRPHEMMRRPCAHTCARRNRCAIIIAR